MGIENRAKVAIVTDSCSSLRKEHLEVQELGINLMPVTVNFFEDGAWKPVRDLSITSEEFYSRMEKSSKVAKTSGVSTADALAVYQSLSAQTNRIISIHISQKLSSGTYAGLLSAQNEMLEAKPDILIDTIDTHQLSFGQALLVAEAAKLAQKGADIESIKTHILGLIPEVQVLAVFKSLENLRNSGRIDNRLKALLASALSIYPIIGVKEGGLVTLENERSFKKATQRMVEMVGEETKRRITRMVVIHTHDEEAGKNLAEKLSTIYKGEIPVCEAGPVIGVHGGPGGLGVAVLRD